MDYGMMIGVNTPSTGRLPSGYTELEYLESTGTQYINTKYTIQTGDTIELLGQLTELFNDNTFFESTTSNYYRCVVNGLSDGKIRYTAGNEKYKDTSVSYGVGTDIEVIINSNLTVNGVNLGSIIREKQSCPVCLFAGNDIGNGTVKRYGKVRIKRFKITNSSGVVQLDYIPARRNSDGEIGLYNAVNGVLETNAGTGTFVAGPALGVDVAREVEQIFVGGVNERKLPSGYTALSYIESTGTQYIETDWMPNVGDILTAETSLSSGTSEAGFIGVPEAFELYYSDMYLYSWDGGYNTHTVLQKESGKVSYNQKNTMKVRFDNSRFAYSKILLFAYRTDQYPFSGRIYLATVENSSGVLIHNYVPCKNADGVLGMYDTVTGIFYTNNGTGSFIAGEVITQPSLVAREVTEGWVEDDLVARLFFGGLMLTFKQQGDASFDYICNDKTATVTISKSGSQGGKAIFSFPVNSGDVVRVSIHCSRGSGQYYVNPSFGTGESNSNLWVGSCTTSGVTHDGIYTVPSGDTVFNILLDVQSSANATWYKLTINQIYINGTQVFPQ